MLLYDNMLNNLTVENITELPDAIPLTLLQENNPVDSDTIGSLISKLSCVTIQMWHNQDILYKIRTMSEKDFVIEYGSEMAKLHALIKRACDLNVQRTDLMDAIDRKLLQLAQ